jgi:hypothetical protein
MLFRFYFSVGLIAIAGGLATLHAEAHQWGWVAVNMFTIFVCTGTLLLDRKTVVLRALNEGGK